MKTLFLDLQLFDGAEGAPAEGATAETGVEGQAAAGDTGVAEPEQTPEERAAEFEKLISENYRDLYEARVKDTISQRLKRYKGIEKQVKDQEEVLGLLNSRYGTSDLQNLRTAIENDNNLWEEAAAEEGLTVDEYRYRKKLEQENKRLLTAMEEAERKNQREMVFQKWNREAEELKSLYPNFNLEVEGQNETFARLLGNGIDMKTAYETIHHAELMQALAAQTAKNVAKAQADAVKNSQKRPSEAGMNSKPLKKTGKSVKDMSRDEIMDLAKRAARGELIEL